MIDDDNGSGEAKEGLHNVGGQLFVASIVFFNNAGRSPAELILELLPLRWCPPSRSILI